MNDNQKDLNPKQKRTWDIKVNKISKEEAEAYFKKLNKSYRKHSKEGTMPPSEPLTLNRQPL